MTGVEGPTYAIDSGWLVEVVNEHTCGTARDGYYGAHEPGCGMVPVVRVEELLKAHAELAATKASLAAARNALAAVREVREKKAGGR